MFRSAILKETPDSQVNLSPMIDMVFILLIFFVVTAVFVVENGFEVRTPEITKMISPDESPPMGIHIDQQNRIFIEENLVSLKSVRPTVAQRVSVSSELNVFVRTAPMVDAGLMVSVLDEVRLGGVSLINLSLDTD